MFLIRILEIVQHLPDTSWGGVGERGTGNFSTKKRYSRKQEKVKMAPIHGEPTCIPSAIICSACALHVLVRRPQAGGTGLSRAAGHLHHTCGASNQTVGQREQELMCLTRAAQELLQIHTQSGQVFHPVPVPSTHLFQCFITVDGYHRNKSIFTSYS